MHEDSEWFSYPEVDSLKCIGCGMCEKVCPVINSTVITKSHKVFAAKAQDDRLRMISSSGGIFTLLAEKMIDSGGVVLALVMMVIGMLFIHGQKQRRVWLNIVAVSMFKAE